MFAITKEQKSRKVFKEILETEKEVAMYKALYEQNSDNAHYAAKLYAAELKLSKLNDEFSKLVKK
jgi:hypothetical protein